METVDSIKRDPRGQGAQGELSAAERLASRGADVFLPLGHSRDIDLMTILDREVLRVQVKTTTQQRNGRWTVAVCTRGGNRSWNGVVKYLDPQSYDWLFVLVADGRRWFIPSDVVGGRTCLLLGGPKYSEYEVESGRPIRVPA